MRPKFILNLLLMSLFLAGATFGVLNYIDTTEQSWFWGALVFYVFLGLAIGWITQRSVNSSNSAFFRGVMGATGLRMILSVLFLAIYLIISDIKAMEFVVYYLILYLFFTIFEIYQLVSKLRTEKRSSLDNTTS
ncbi:MAG: hypothetical protein KJP21_02965 [Bacteroidia bacterium]|nr:hypothetical protein [Bacteroidia bacterium]